MTQLAALAETTWRAAQALSVIAWLGRWRTIETWACLLYMAAAALAWSLRWTGATVTWTAA